MDALEHNVVLEEFDFSCENIEFWARHDATSVRKPRKFLCNNNKLEKLFMDLQNAGTDVLDIFHGLLCPSLASAFSFWV